MSGQGEHLLRLQPVLAPERYEHWDNDNNGSQFWNQAEGRIPYKVANGH